MRKDVSYEETEAFGYLRESSSLLSVIVSQMCRWLRKMWLVTTLDKDISLACLQTCSRAGRSVPGTSGTLS